MASSPEEEVQEEIKKAQAWYGKTYKKTFEVHQRYDKVDKHFSYRLIAQIGGQERLLAFGLSAEAIEHPSFKFRKGRISTYIQTILTKAQAKWEPHILRSQ